MQIVGCKINKQCVYCFLLSKPLKGVVDWDSASCLTCSTEYYQ